MSTLTSFGTFHEPPSQAEDPPENVFSKLFLRVKNTLSTSNTSEGQSSSTDSPANDSYPSSLVASPTTSESFGISSIRGGTDNGTISSFTLGSDSGSWVISSDGKGSNSVNRKSVSTSSSRSGEQLGFSTEDKDKTISTRRLYPGSSVSKRPSSLFKVSTMDHSIIKDDDSVSLTSLAPPVVSFSPAFGDQQIVKDALLNEYFGTATAKPTVADQAKPSAGSGSAKDYIHSALRVKDTAADSDTRSIRSFSSGHHKGNSLTKLIRRARGEGVSKEYWMTDENAKECFGCSAPFSMIRRKHHCRICGVIFCSKCAFKIIPGAKLGYEGYLRVCNYCLDFMQQYEQQESNSADYAPGSSWQAPSPSSVHGHSTQPIPITTGATPTQVDATPLEGIRKLINAGSNLFLARSRSNTTGDHIDGGVVPFRRSLAFEDGDLNDPILDPEIAPFMGEDDEDDQDDFWPTSTPDSIIVPLNGPDKDVGSDDDPSDYTPKERVLTRTFKGDPNRRSINGNRPNRNLSLNLKTRGLMRSDGSESARSPLDVRPASPFLVPNSQALLHTNRHSRAASMAAGRVEINSASLQHMRRLLGQLLARSEIDNADEWEEVIMKVVLKVSNSIQILRSMDVLNAVKLKRIPGGTAQDTLYINGVVFTKNLAHKQMSRTLHNPRILILKFALEYQRVENHFISLEPIVNQEKEYLQHLVARIIGLSPHIIVVEKTVSRLALELLLKYNVAVAYNVKAEVIDAISLSTGADSIMSFDQLVKEPRLGTCGLFEVKTFVHELIPNKRKSYMFFQHCPGNHFCSLVLRGGSLDMLNRVKQIVELMVWVSYNLKLETSLMNDQFAMTSPLPESRIAEEEAVEVSSDSDISQLQGHLIPYKQTILSASPFVRFNPPFILTQMIADAQKLKGIEQSTTPTALRDIGNSKVMFASSSASAIMNKSLAGRSQDSGFVEGAYIDISNDFQAKSKAWEDYLNIGISPPLIVPFACRNLAFLFSQVCTSTKSTCHGPEIVPMRYYTHRVDFTLAYYLGQLCLDSNYPCRIQSCARPLLDHQHIYAHGDAKVVITVEQWDSSTSTTLKRDSIMMWSKCKICNVETQQACMSDDTKNYSFGKYLELIMYQSNLTCRASICKHDINRDHIRYFGINTRLVKIERIPIRLYDINFPPMLVRCKPEFAAGTKNQDLDLIRSLITRYWDSVVERINNCIFDVVQPSKIEGAKKELLQMLDVVKVERRAILQHLQQTYLNSSPTDTLALNMVRIKLYDKAEEWKRIFGKFAREYFNPDRDFRRSTTSRRLFDEKEFPVASDRARHSSVTNDLPMTLDSNDIDGETIDDPQDLSPADLPYLGSSPTLKATKPKVEEADVAALESAIETASSQIAFPYIEPKVTRRLSMNLMQELRPKLTQTLTSESIVTVTSEDLSEKSRSRGPTPPPTIPRIPPPNSSRSTTRVSSRLSMVTLPTIDSATLLNQERKENHPTKNSLVTITSPHSRTSSPMGNKFMNDKVIIPLDRTPSTERPSSSSSSSSGKNPFFFSKPRSRRPTESTTSPTMSPSSPPSGPLAMSEKVHPFSIGPATPSVSSRRNLYLARAQVPPTQTPPVPPEPPKSSSGNRSRALTQPMPGQNGNARARYLNALSGRSSRQLETKQPAIEVFASVKEAAKEESDDEDDYQSEGEGEEPYRPSRGYTFSLIQTDAMDEALGSEDPSTMETTNNLRGSFGGAGGSGWNNGEDMFPDPASMMYLGDDDYLTDQQHSTTAPPPPPPNSVKAGHTHSSSISSIVGSPPTKSSMNMTVTGTLTAALAAASKLPQLSEVAEGVERGSLIKTLSTFWQDRNSPNFTPLDYPMQPSEHVFPDSQIIVREDEPSSIIALTLSSSDYVKRLKGIFKGGGNDASSTNHHATAPMPNSGTATPAEDSVVSSFDGSGNSSPLSSAIMEGIYDDIQVSDDSLLWEPGTHMKFSLPSGSTMLYCKIFYMEQFHALRKASGCEYSYIQSLARCMKWDATGGKSGSSFLKTKDDRFIMKQLSKVELEAFIKFAPHYFQYMHKAIYQKRPTVLAKIFGFYRVGYKHGALGRSMNIDVLVMENLFYDRKQLQIFDLKGSRRNRYVQPSGRDNEVLLDENFIEFMSESPFFIRQHAKLQLLESLANDSYFLQRFNIMDYSLLVAIADNRQEILVGIVDFIRPFTWDKKLESWVKDAVGSREPTIVSPAQYRKRFRAAIKHHLDMVPDRWFDIESHFAEKIVRRSAATERSHYSQQYIQEADEYEQEWSQPSENDQRKSQLHSSTPSGSSRAERMPDLPHHSRYNTSVQLSDESRPLSRPLSRLSSRPSSSLIN
ncbi:hypothetical protein B0O80DRAFT_460532 [Mortierella sp. GBAus27b]|nr:1-phosphatidylinositol-3-phosphate 5-kinase [Mortierella sp. GBA43]KAI8349368.1 hypothetical protein B0O80DRAFT_460532 [Mortierella sp. GBAus27b]